MQPTLIFLLVASVISTAQSQTWAGTYTADSSCSTSSCCCLTGQVTVTSLSTNTYTVSSSVTGICSGLTTYSSTAYTNGYTGWIMFGTNNDTLALSSDSKTITVTNSLFPACSGKGVKSGAIKQHVNLIMLFSIVLIGIMKKASKI